MNAGNGSGLALGVALGVGVGMAMDNLAVGMAPGLTVFNQIGSGGAEAADQDEEEPPSEQKY
ncbi:MAG TPA: hypothetical protein EYF98_07175 [Planctomycetes bacterium]|nr:hypothetical protein [Planctomycetota bacterium]